MKMVKSLLLGSAAGIVAVAGAQAADLPVKAKPVEYVKICSMYGAGFYYIPGTDTCLKVGGSVFAEWNFNAGGGHGPFMGGNPGRDTRADTQAYSTRSRAIATFDARTQTEYGTLRSYIAAGWEQNSGDANYRGICFFSRAFIQFAGITAGKTRSFFTFYGNALNYSTLQGGGHSDAGLNLIAYTAQLGGGISATLSVEDGTHHRTGIWNAETRPLLVGAVAGGASTTSGISNAEGPGLAGPGSYAARTFPDIVGQINISQPWGQAQIMAAVHDASGSYHGAERIPNGSEGNNKVGFAVGGGLMFNLPWAQGDQFWVQGVYTRGATNYLGFNPFVHTGGSAFAMFRGTPTAGCGSTITPGSCGNVGLAWALDGLYDQPGGNGNGRMELVEGWSILAAIQHFWTPSLRTSVFGHYTSVNFGTEGREIFCRGAVTGTAGATTQGHASFNPASENGCNPDFNVWQIGTRTVWSPVRNLDIGVEFLYSRLDQKFDGTWNIPNTGGRPAGLYEARDQDTFNGNIRITRNFWP